MTRPLCIVQFLKIECSNFNANYAAKPVVHSQSPPTIDLIPSTRASIWQHIVRPTPTDNL